MLSRKFIFVLVCLLAVAVSCGSSSVADDSVQEVKKIKSSVDRWLLSIQPSERTLIGKEWYGVYMFGQKTGWGYHTVERVVSGNKTNYLTRDALWLSVKRHDTRLKIINKTEYVESTKGALKGFFYYEMNGESFKVNRGKLVNNTLYWTNSDGTRTNSFQRVVTGKLYTPLQLERLVAANGYRPAVYTNIRYFFGDFPGQDRVMKLTVTKPEQVNLLGEQKELIRVEYDLGPFIKLNTWITGSGIVYKSSSMNIVELYRMPKKIALQPGDPRDLLQFSAVRSSKQLIDPAAVEKLRVRIHFKKGQRPVKIPTGVMQRISAQTSDYVELQIKRVAVNQSDQDNILKKKELQSRFGEYLKSTPFLQADAPLIRQLAGRIKGGLQQPRLIAKRMAKWVYENIKKKNYSVILDTALQTVKKLEGDCTEHAVLLAALCRAAGIPSRVVVGLVYSDQMKQPGFFFHMWTEAFTGKWIPLDAALGGAFVDATHIAFSKSGLEDNYSAFEEISRIILFIKSRIEVLD